MRAGVDGGGGGGCLCGDRAVSIVKILGGQSVERIFLRNFVGGRWLGDAWIMIRVSDIKVDNAPS